MSPDVLICPACGGRLTPWRTWPSAEPDLGPARVDLARCERCRTAVSLGDPVRSAHSAGAYRPTRPRGAHLAAPLLSVFDRQRLSLLPPPPARLIDAGAGRGRFVAAARLAGYQAIGIEPSLRDVDPTLGLINATIAEAPIVTGSADVVTLWHVLEHLEDPEAALGELRRWLVPGGTLVLGVPNLGSLQARISGGAWFHLDLPRHRTHFTVPGLRQLLRTCGFVPRDTRHLLAEHNPYGMWQSLVSLATERPGYLYNLLKHNAPALSPDLILTLAALPLLPSAVLLEALAGLAGAGGTVAVIARRA
ncbi:class I SAM-dependent methyltransferase [Conexibacter sp. DBS9H8]|uniref:class I SAM-dependent methyltransferase n=1 Tax=Conexibacter sp. DBS9H8 TaxID=2937801 RepID=UPI00200E3FF3|nr:class I SAM-dependent methyltransferase [Conexibacter sp. DBS9H8]